MSTLTEEFPKRLSLSMLVSVALHGAVVAGLLFASFHQTPDVPAPDSAISVSMVAPEVQPEAAKSQPQPVQPVTPVQPEPQPPQVQPEPAQVPEPPVTDKPVAIEKPATKPKPKPKTVPEVKPRPVHKKPAEKPVRPAEKTPVATQQAVAQKQTTADQTKAQTAPKSVPGNQRSVSDGQPRAVSITRPGYPARALAFHMEGRVKVQFDVDNDGRVINARIIDAQPKNMFDREVRLAMKRWRYQSGKPGSGITMNIVFRIDGSSDVE